MSATHATLGPLLSAFLDDELDPIRRGQVAAHLATCPICAQELTHLRAGDEALAGLRSTPTAPDMRPRVRLRLRQESARLVLTGGLVAAIVVLARAIEHDAAIMKRTELPLWGRLGLASGNMLLAAPGIALCVELLRDVRVLVEYAWLSDETTNVGEPQ